MLHAKQCSEWISSEVIWQAMTLRSGPLRKRRDFPGHSSGDCILGDQRKSTVSKRGKSSPCV